MSGVPEDAVDARDARAPCRAGRAFRSGSTSRGVRADVERPRAVWSAAMIKSRSSVPAALPDGSSRPRRSAWAARTSCPAQTASLLVHDVPPPSVSSLPLSWAWPRNTRGVTPRSPRGIRESDCLAQRPPGKTPWQNAPPKASPAPRPLTTSTRIGGTSTRSLLVLARTPSGPSLTTAVSGPSSSSGRPPSRGRRRRPRPRPPRGSRWRWSRRAAPTTRTREPRRAELPEGGTEVEVQDRVGCVASSTRRAASVAERLGSTREPPNGAQNSRALSMASRSSSAGRSRGRVPWARGRSRWGSGRGERLTERDRRLEPRARAHEAVVDAESAKRLVDVLAEGVGTGPTDQRAAFTEPRRRDGDVRGATAEELVEMPYVDEAAGFGGIEVDAARPIVRTSNTSFTPPPRGLHERNRFRRS